VAAPYGISGQGKVPRWDHRNATIVASLVFLDCNDVNGDQSPPPTGTKWSSTTSHCTTLVRTQEQPSDEWSIPDPRAALRQMVRLGVQACTRTGYTALLLL